jgi:YYY domain-containing protein
MSAALSWYVAVQGLGFLAFLMSAPFLRVLPDAGYASSKALGVLLFGLLVWSGTAVGVLRNEPGGALLALIVLGAAALVQVTRARHSGTAGERHGLPARHVIVAVELIFLAAFAGWCLVRFADPAANHTEQPMDLMLLTAISASPTFPVGDPWLSGFPIGYYYLGYWLMSSVGFLAAIEPGVAYNTGQASWFGLLLTTCFGIGYNLTVLGTTASGASVRRAALAAGGFAAVLVGLASNLHLPLEWIAARSTGGPETLGGSWWWWRSSRAVRDLDLAGQPIEIITEFPFFSYLLGDNHPHLLAMPFVGLIVSLCLALLLNGRKSSIDPSPDGAIDSRVGPGALVVVACAALVGLNTWDFPAAVLLGLLALAMPLAGAPPIRSTRRPAATLLTASLLAILVLTVPYFLTAQSQVRGVLPNLFHPTALSQFATMFGALAPGVLLLLRVAWSERPPAGWRIAIGVTLGLGACALWLVLGGSWAANSSAGAEWLARMTAPGTDPFGAAVDRWLTGWPVLAVLVVALAVTVTLVLSRLRGVEKAAGITFGLVLTAIGLLLALVPEVVYAHDNFGTRMNTVFKFYYQAWLYLSLAGALGMTLAWTRGGRLRVAAAGAALVLLAALMYAPAALWTKTQEGRAASGSLDALDYLRRQRPDDHAAILWVRANTRPGDVIAQAPGNSYDVAHNVISVATARPTLLGWEGHERQWRGQSYDAMAAGRHAALARIYAPGSDSELQQTLLAWNVMFVYLGPVERARYSVSASHEARLGRSMELVFEQGGIRIYRRRG